MVSATGILSQNISVHSSQIVSGGETAVPPASCAVAGPSGTKPPGVRASICDTPTNLGALPANRVSARLPAIVSSTRRSGSAYGDAAASPGTFLPLVIPDPVVQR